MDKRGFSIKCNRCENQLNLATEDDIFKSQISKESEIRVLLHWGFEEGEIVCECGNRIGF